MAAPLHLPTLANYNLEVHLCRPDFLVGQETTTSSVSTLNTFSKPPLNTATVSTATQTNCDCLFLPHLSFRIAFNRGPFLLCTHACAQVGHSLRVVTYAPISSRNLRLPQRSSTSLPSPNIISLSTRTQTDVQDGSRNTSSLFSPPPTTASQCHTMVRFGAAVMDYMSLLPHIPPSSRS